MQRQNQKRAAFGPHDASAANADVRKRGRAGDGTLAQENQLNLRNGANQGRKVGENNVQASETAVTHEMMEVVDAVHSVRRPVIIDLDELHMNDPLYLVEYGREIHSYLKNLESRHAPAYSFMDNQLEITRQMRAILVDWMIEVVSEFDLQEETFYLAVNYVDRYLSTYRIQRNKLQLLGVAALFLAMKFEEVHVYSVDDFVYVTQNSYTKQEILRWESALMETLKFHLLVATPLIFLRRYSDALQLNNNGYKLAAYILELIQQEYGFHRFLPSSLTAAAVSLAAHTLNLPCWNATLEKECGFTRVDLQCAVDAIHRIYAHAGENVLQAVRHKYDAEKHLHVSRITSSATPPKLAEVDC